MNPYEIVGFAFGVLAVWLTVRESVWCWPIGLVNVGVYIVVFYQARLYAGMGLQVIYVILCLYGWYHWLHGGKGHGALAVSRTPRGALIGLVAAGVAGAWLLGSVLHGATDASLPFWDSGMAWFSLVAQYMQTRKWVENWIIWIVVDVVYVGIYVAQSLHLTAGLYAVFLVLAVLGLREWKRSLRSSASS